MPYALSNVNTLGCSFSPLGLVIDTSARADSATTTLQNQKKKKKKKKEVDEKVSKKENKINRLKTPKIPK
jgi:hypothetical protein